MARSRKRSAFNVQVDIDLAGLALQVADEFERFGAQALPRAMQFGVNGVAIDAVRRFREAMPAALDRPNPWTLKGLAYEADKASLGQVTSLGQVKATIFIQKEQSEYLKYLFGFDSLARPGGDIGLEGKLPSEYQDLTLVPFWKNIELTQRVRPDKYGNVPTSFMRRVRQNVTNLVTGRSDTSEAKRKRGMRATAQWSMWSGEIRLKGSTVQAIIARPPRKVVGRSGVDADRKRKFISSSRGLVRTRQVVETDTPRILFLRPPEAHYEPILQKPWERSLADAVATLPARLRYELMEKRRNADSGIAGGGTTRKGLKSEYLALRRGRVVDSTRRFGASDRYGADA